MERKIGEVFECDGKKLQVIEAPFYECDGCCFANEGDCNDRLEIRGRCEASYRGDGHDVIFIELKDMNEENKQSILDEAKAIIEGNRQTDYGNAVDNFQRISDIVNSMYPDLVITPEQCCAVLIAVKLIREGYRHKRDNLVDLCGYAHIMNEINESEKEGE